jgi:hypothetical protein
VNAPIEGKYDLTFRYAATVTNGDGRHPGAVREFWLNSQAMGNLTFISLQDFALWTSQTVARVPLQAGPNSVSLLFDSADGSYGWMNIDQLIVSRCPTNDGENLLHNQPTPGDWQGDVSDHFFTGAAYACGFGVHWQTPGDAPGKFIRLYPNDPTFAANLQPGHTYLASITMSGTGIYHLNMFDGGGALPDGGAGGIRDNPSPSAALSDVPRSFMVPFRMGTGIPELQVRVDGPGQIVDVDVIIWHVAIYLN